MLHVLVYPLCSRHITLISPDMLFGKLDGEMEMVIETLTNLAKSMSSLNCLFNKRSTSFFLDKMVWTLI